MRELFSRLRASLSPQALAVFAALALLLAISGKRSDVENLEARIARTLSAAEGAGRVQVTIRMREGESGASGGMMKTVKSVPGGAVAVAQGADDPLVAMQLSDALCALLGLAPGEVSVIAGGR